MSTNNFIPFTVNIVNFHTNGFFNVEYIPQNANCSPMFIQVEIDEASIPDTNLVSEIITLCSPQYYWNKQLNVSSMDTTHLQAMSNTQIVVTTDPTANLVQLAHTAIATANTTQGLTPDQIQQLRTTTLIQKVLSEMIGATI
jgi:hypothetical protein